jgi:hypothetical protein
MANGGSLTINPKTGLPEAFFLAALLPTIAGMGLKAAGMSALGSALTVGAVGTLTSGSLRKGLMAGLGAFGGANFAGALAAKGAAALPAAGAAANAGAATAAPSLASDAINQMQSGILSSPILKAGTNLAAVPAQGVMSTATMGGNALLPAGAGPMNLAAAPMSSPLTVPISNPTVGSELEAMGRGFKKVISDPKEIVDFVEKNPVSSMSVLSALSQSMGRRSSRPKDEDVEPLEKYRYVYDREPVGVAASRSSERDYFPNARYEPTGERFGASGGLMALANGGTVEDMSRMNVVGANTGYPMANQMSSTYANPAERPISENIIHPQGDANVDPYTGEQKFARGGATYVGGGYDNRGEESAKNADDVKEINYFDPNYYNPKTGTYGYQTGSTTAQQGGPSAADQKKTMITNLFNQYLGRDPDKKSLDFYAEDLRDQEGIKQDILGSKEYIQSLSEPVRPGVIKYAYKDVLGRDPDESGLQTYGVAGTTPDQIRQSLIGSEEGKAFQAAKEAKAKEATYATAEQAADAYERIMGRRPDAAGLKYYTKTNRMTPEEMEKSLRESDEYFYNLTKPFVPAIHYGANGVASIEGAPYYDPTQYGFDPSQTNARNEIKGLYQNQLGRIADPRGEQYWADTIGADNKLSKKDIARFKFEADKEMKARQEGYAMGGGVSDLGGYSDGGRLLKGPGDGVSDSIPAVIGQRQPARLADGEFVIPARIVSELGNGSTDAGARKLYAMMNRIQSARKKSVGKGKVATNTKSEKYLPA